MENEKNEKNEKTAVTAVAGEAKWRKLVRRQSSKLVTLADIVLPKNERVLRQIPERITIEMSSVESQQPQTTVPQDETLVPRKTEKFPYFMIGISLAQILIFYSYDEGVLTMRFGYDPYRRHELWRFISTMFVHSSWSHLWGNLVYQLILGVFLEIVHEWKRIAIIYFASAIGGNMFITAFSNESYAVGASDAVMGLLAAHMGTIILNWNEMDRKFSRFFCLSLYIVHDIASNVYMEWYYGGYSNISHVAHIGGAVTGLLVSIIVLKNLKKLPWEATLQKICMGILLAGFVIIFTMNVTLTDYFPKNEWNFDYKRTYEGDGDDYDYNW